MNNILISSFDMEVGGVERSLISMLENFNYKNFSVNLFLYKKQGDFLKFIPEKVNILNEIPEYSTFRKSILEVLKEKNHPLAVSRLLSKVNADLIGKLKGFEEPGYLQMQLMWRYALPFLPAIEKEYDVAISYLWPHYFIAEKVKAKKKIAWIHTDYSTVETDIKNDLKMWNKFDHIIAVSEACKHSFLQKYPQLKYRTMVIENITSPEFIINMSKQQVDNPMLKDGRFKIVSVARLSHAKGIDNAVKAFRLLRDRGYKDLVWYVVGYGGDEQLIRDLIRDYNLTDSFILLGKKTNPYPYVNTSDLYVQPSRYEGKAVTVTEAQILLKPVLITNYPTAKSQINNMLDGIICDLSVEGIADGIEKLYKNAELRNELSNTCYSKNFENRTELSKLYNLMGLLNTNDYQNKQGVI